MTTPLTPTPKGVAAPGGCANLLFVLVSQTDLTDSDIRSILFDMAISGSDTTAFTASAALYVLHEPRNAIWLEGAREELEQTNIADGVHLSDVQRTLPMATAISRDILRLYPPVLFVGRTAEGDGSHISSEEGQTTTVQCGSLQRSAAAGCLPTTHVQAKNNDIP